MSHMQYLEQHGVITQNCAFSAHIFLTSMNYPKIFYSLHNDKLKLKLTSAGIVIGCKLVWK